MDLSDYAKYGPILNPLDPPFKGSALSDLHPLAVETSYRVGDESQKRRSS
jgi:hypothetical protein